ncbi:MAG: tyrosine-type recombinase/integrase [Candidatus Accumulibacter delftensis]|jgi:integrase/recombinase XerD
MTLSAQVSMYIAHKRALGYKFETEEAIFKSFCRTVGEGPLASVEGKSVLAFLNGNGPVSAYWVKKYHVLSGFYRFALARGLVSSVPLPYSLPRLDAPVFVPYIYSHDELKRLLDAVPIACTGRAPIDAYVFRALLLLLYGAGLRISEAVSLNIADVDLEQARLIVRGTKFYKSRLVPLGKDLTHVMSEYVGKRNDRHSGGADTPFFCFRNGAPLSKSAARAPFDACELPPALPATVAQESSHDSTTCVIRPPFIGSSPGIAAAQTCTISCPSWRPTSAT